MVHDNKSACKNEGPSPNKLAKSFGKTTGPNGGLMNSMMGYDYITSAKKDTRPGTAEAAKIAVKKGNSKNKLTFKRNNKDKLVVSNSAAYKLGT